MSVPGAFCLLNQPQFLSDCLKTPKVCRDKTEFLPTRASSRLRRSNGEPWVLGETAQNRSRKLHTSRLLERLSFCQKAKALSIALKALKISSANLVKTSPRQESAVNLRASEPMLDCRLTSVSEGRIANIMRQACSGDDCSKIGSCDSRVCQFSVPINDFITNHHAQRAAHGRNFQTVCQSRSDVVVFGKGKYLRFILKTSKSRRKQDTVEISLERGTWPSNLNLLSEFFQAVLVKGGVSNPSSTSKSTLRIFWQSATNS